MVNKYSIFFFIFLLFNAACKEEEPTPIENNDDDTIQSISNVSGTNILLVIADDIGVDASPNYNIGAVKPNMPRLESLMETGITFDNAWSNPVCAPTRATILTGKYGYHTGVLNAEDQSRLASSETSIQSFLDQYTNNAYNQAVIGKWHLSNNNTSGPNELGVPHFAGILGGGVNNYSNWSLVENEQSSLSTEYTTSKLTDLAIEWINDQDKPWFCWLAYNAAHTPFHLPPNDLHYQGNLPDDETSIESNPLPYYMAMIESLDTEMGRLLDSIPADELSNTLIIFIGDNGTPGQVAQSPYNSNKSKGSMFQGGVHVPMVISGKGVTRQGQRDNNLVSSVDLFATISEVVGMDLDHYEDSHSFIDLLSSPSQGPRTYNYAEASGDNPNRSGYTIRNDRYKLITSDSEQNRFYDLQNDPYEENNLVNGAGPSSEESVILQTLMEEANSIRK